jgi:transketolase
MDPRQKGNSMATSTAALQDMANQLRIDSIESTSAAGSGHPSSCCSMAELMSVLFFDEMKYHVSQPRHPDNDRFVLSKGHAAPILYAAWAEAGLFPRSEILKLRQFGNDLEGHPTPRLSFVDVATGSLGQGLSAGAGMAYVGKHIDHGDYRVYVLMGDGESAEGSVWEAASFASHYKLDNLVAIVDVNRLGQSEPTMFQHRLDVYKARFDSFGWNAVIVDGHDVDAIRAAFAQARQTGDRPTALIAKTFKGKGIPGVEDADNWHGKALGDKTQSSIDAIQQRIQAKVSIKPTSPPAKLSPAMGSKIVPPALGHKLGEKIATRAAYGVALAKIGAQNNNVVALDGDTKNSTFADKFRALFPDRYCECFIAEQNLVGVAVGMGTRGKLPFVSTFAAFFTRAFDQIRMAAISQAKVTLVGSHAGVSIGEDGPSQMALEDLAMFRTIPGGLVFYPSDATSTAAAVAISANHCGISFIRTSRPVTPTLYADGEPFEAGKAKVVKQSPKDQVTIVGAGITLAEAMIAAEELAKEGIAVRVIDPFTIKPLDKSTILAAAKATGGKIITVEDHYPEGGLGDAVAGELATETGIVIHKLAVRELPRSGKPEELVDHYGIGARSIAAKVREII